MICGLVLLKQTRTVARKNCPFFSDDYSTICQENKCLLIVGMFRYPIDNRYAGQCLSIRANSFIAL